MQLHKNSVPEEPKKKHGIVSIVAVVSAVVIGIIALALFHNDIKKWFDPVAIVANVSAAQLQETDGRTNILVLGSDKRSNGTVTSELTDTILVVSIGRVDKDVVLISIPRDLWVKTSLDYYTKINSVYAYEGATGLRSVIQDVLGIPIHYHTLVTFDLFQEAIDILGGVNVTVDNTFTDYYYPIEGKETAPENERYATVHFNAGTQTMDGKTALTFVRSRKGDNNEGTDFARAKRQQKVIAALKEKLLSIQTLLDLGKIKSLFDTYSKNVNSDIDFGAIQNFYLLSQQITFDRIKSIVLDDRSNAVEGGLLYAPEDTSLYGGQYVLLPQTGDYSQIHAYVQQYLFSGK